MKGRLLTTISIVLFVAGIVTGNLNSTVWAKDDYKPDARYTLGLSESTNRDIKTQANDNGKTQANDNGNTQANDNGNTQANDNGNTQANDNGNTQSDTGNFQINNSGSHSCDSECQKAIDDAMDTMDDLF